MKKILILILATAMLAGCAPSEQSQPIVDLNPMPIMANKDETVVTLYFGSRSENLLVAEPRTITVPTNQRIEEVVLTELLKGPSSEVWEIYSLIDDETQIVTIEEEANVLTVTLTADFMDSGQGETMKLAVHSIVNTLVELAEFSKVQILIDTLETGSGQRPTAADMGFEGTGALEPLERNEDIVLDAQKTAELLFALTVSQDYQQLYNFIANEDIDEQAKPNSITFSSVMSGFTQTIESYSVRDVVISGNGIEAVVMVDFTKRLPSSEIVEYTNIPIKLVKENYVYKLYYSDYSRIFLT